MDKIIAPEMDLIKTDEFYLFYEMMMQSLKTDDVKEGINKSLFLLRKFLKSGNIVLFKKNSEGCYTFKDSDSDMKKLLQSVGYIINNTSPLTEQKGIFNIDLELSDELHNMELIHIKLDDRDCILGIININKENRLEELFWERLKDTMQIILKRAVMYERNTQAITTDLLTGVDNRNSYEMRLQSLNEADNNLVLAIFDLFRLKYINDNYTHSKGDLYIKEAAKILSKYWPKYNVNVCEDGTERITNTGHCIYRVGGDEFVLLTNVETLRYTDLKAKLARDESFIINLGIEEKIPLGFNYGAVLHKPGDAIKQTLARADIIMQEDKAKMYVKYNLERRR